jgi:transcriptional regulator with GAF, ATPase, and Fis domain
MGAEAGPLPERGGQPEGLSGRSGRMIGRSSVLLALLRRIEVVAPTEATVLILGERGTGKELVADAIREGSRRSAGPFIKVNCAALPGELLASELFGHERGAFTGAHERREGLLAAAHGGTLFLDEMGDLAPAAQAMLLRFLQTREVLPIGARRAHQVDVRVIAATNKDLERAMASGEFRADFYDRLREVALEVPPLRERWEDIPLLTEHFLEVAGARHDRPRPVLAAEARRALQHHSWPGNVRELEQTLSSAVIFAGAHPIRARHLWPKVSLGAEPFWRGCKPTSEIVGPEAMNVRQRAALELAVSRGTVRPLDIMRRFVVSREMARRDLAALVAAGFLQRVGATGRGVRYIRPGQ